MKIFKKIKAYSDLMKTPGGATTANRIQKESVAAVLGGRQSKEWETYMKNFHSNAEQLQRLLGNEGTGEGEFMDPNSWGPTILAYIGISGTCGGGTTMGPVTDLPSSLINRLDAGISEDTVPGESEPIPSELEPFL